MKFAADKMKVYYTHKQSTIEAGLKNKLKEIMDLTNSLDLTNEENQKLSILSKEAYNGIEGYFDIVEIINRNPHPHRKQEYLTIKFIKKNLTLEIDTETFNKFYSPIQFQTFHAPVKIKKELYYA